MTSGTNSSESGLSSKKNSKMYDNYLKELNEGLKLRKQELLEMLKPLGDKNNLLLQKVMANLEEKQKSLQIMRQIMAGRGCDESSIMELITEPEEMKQNLTFESEELRNQQKALPTKSKADMQDRKNSFQDKMIELKIEALRNYQKTNDFKLSLYLQRNFESKQEALNLLRPQGRMGTTTMERATSNRNELDMRIPGSKNYTEQQGGTRGSQYDDVGQRLFFSEVNARRSSEGLEGFPYICFGQI